MIEKHEQICRKMVPVDLLLVGLPFVKYKTKRNKSNLGSAIKCNEMRSAYSVSKLLYALGNQNIHGTRFIAIFTLFQGSEPSLPYLWASSVLLLNKYIKKHLDSCHSRVSALIMPTAFPREWLLIQRSHIQPSRAKQNPAKLQQTCSHCEMEQ